MLETWLLENIWICASNGCMVCYITPIAEYVFGILDTYTICFLTNVIGINWIMWRFQLRHLLMAKGLADGSAALTDVDDRKKFQAEHNKGHSPLWLYPVIATAISYHLLSHTWHSDHIFF